MSESGKYIVFEGNDGTGKSTQVRQYTQYLSGLGHEAVMIEEPGSEDIDKSTPVANYLRRVIKDASIPRGAEIDLALFSAARRELWQQKISPALARGAYVLSARNYFSTFAYQGEGSGLDEQHILETTALFTDSRYMRPDHMLILTLDDEDERARRIAGRGELETPDTFESRGQDFQDRVNKSYVRLAEKYSIPMIACVTADGTAKSVDEIQKEIIELIGI